MILKDIIYYFKRKIITGFKVGKKELVIDIGSGDKPFWRADVYLDRLDLDNTQRATKSKTLTSFGVFIDGDVTNMPFKDKVFDFSFCSHLLEHVNNPEKAINEINRISKRGYIEVPNGIFDSINPFPTHLWLIYLNDNKLIFVRKDKKMTEIIKKNGEMYKDLIKKAKDPFIRFYWKDEIEFEIIDYMKKERYYFIDQKIPDNKRKYTINKYTILNSLIRLFFYKKKEIKIEDLVR